MVALVNGTTALEEVSAMAEGEERGVGGGVVARVRRLLAGDPGLEAPAKDEVLESEDVRLLAARLERLQAVIPALRGVVAMSSALQALADRCARAKDGRRAPAAEPASERGWPEWCER